MQEDRPAVPTATAGSDSDTDTSSSGSGDPSSSDSEPEEARVTIPPASQPQPSPQLAPRVRKPPPRFPRRQKEHFQAALAEVKKLRRSKWVSDFGPGVLPLETVMSDKAMHQLSRKQKIFTLDDLRDAVKPPWPLASTYGEEVIAVLALVDAAEFGRKELVRKRKAEEEEELQEAKRRKEEASRPINDHLYQYGQRSNSRLFPSQPAPAEPPSSSSSRNPLAEQGAGPSRANRGSQLRNKGSQVAQHDPVSSSFGHKENTSSAAPPVPGPSTSSIPIFEQQPDLEKNRRNQKPKPTRPKPSAKASQSKGSSKPKRPPPASSLPPS